MASRLVDTSENKALSRIGQRRQVIIPKKVFDAMKIKPGDTLEITTEVSLVSMKLKKVIDEDQLTPSEARKVRHGLKQTKDGKTRPWSQIKHELGL